MYCGKTSFINGGDLKSGSGRAEEAGNEREVIETTFRNFSHFIHRPFARPFTKIRGGGGIGRVPRLERAFFQIRRVPRSGSAFSYRARAALRARVLLNQASVALGERVLLNRARLIKIVRNAFYN